MKLKHLAASAAAVASLTVVVTSPTAHAADNNWLACRGGADTPGTHPSSPDRNGVSLDSCLEINNNNIVAMRAYAISSSGKTIELVLRLMEDPWDSGNLVRILTTRSGQQIIGPDVFRSVLGPIEHGTYYVASAGYILNGVEYDDVQSQVMYQP